jgi:hypothetical protein
MKLLLSWVRDFVDIDVPAKTLADTMALRGFEVASIDDLGNGDAVVDFEVTANRPDCLSVIGFAREIATTWNLPMRDLASLPGALASLETGAMETQAGLCAELGLKQPVMARHTIRDNIADCGAFLGLVGGTL